MSDLSVCFPFLRVVYDCVYIYVHEDACLNFWWVCYQNSARLGANMLLGKSEICNQDWGEDTKLQSRWRWWYIFFTGGAFMQIPLHLQTDIEVLASKMKRKNWISFSWNMDNVIMLPPIIWIHQNSIKRFCSSFCFFPRGEEFCNMWVKVLAKFHPFAQTFVTIYTLSIAFKFLTP